MKKLISHGSGPFFQNNASNNQPEEPLPLPFKLQPDYQEMENKQLDNTKTQFIHRPLYTR